MVIIIEENLSNIMHKRIVFFPLEEATQQNINHLTRSSFNSSVYQELLNILVPLSFLHGLDYVTKYFDSPM